MAPPSSVQDPMTSADEVGQAPAPPKVRSTMEPPAVNGVTTLPVSRTSPGPLTVRSSVPAPASAESWAATRPTAVGSNAISIAKRCTPLPAALDHGTMVVVLEVTRAFEGRLTTKVWRGVAVGVGEPDRVGLGELTIAVGVPVGMAVFGTTVAELVGGAVRVGVAVRVLVAVAIDGGVLV